MIVLYILIVNGGYIFWFVWGSCLKLCGSGMKFWFWFCINLLFVYGGSDCSSFGLLIGFILCNIYNCLSEFLYIIIIINKKYIIFL